MQQHGLSAYRRWTHVSPHTLPGTLGCTACHFKGFEFLDPKLGWVAGLGNGQETLHVAIQGEGNPRHTPSWGERRHCHTHTSPFRQRQEGLLWWTQVVPQVCPECGRPRQLPPLETARGAPARGYNGSLALASCHTLHATGAPVQQKGPSKSPASTSAKSCAHAGPARPPTVVFWGFTKST